MVEASTVSRGVDGSSQPYPGGKGGAGIHQWLIGKMRTHAYYAEICVGKGSLLRRKMPALRSIAIDSALEVVTWWRKLAWPGTDVIHGDGLRWLEEVGPELDEDWLVYIDPPYLHATRSKLKIYRHEWPTPKHRRLLRCVLGLRCGVMISGYANPLYDGLLRGWHSDQHIAMTRGGTRWEKVWTNYDPADAAPALALQYSCLAGDYRERERIARKIKRWEKNLRRLPLPERRALLLAILDSADLARPGVDVYTAAGGVARESGP